MKKTFKWIIVISLFTGISYFICDYYYLAKGIQDDARKADIVYKRFMKSLALDGAIVKKTYCVSCDYRSKYQLVLSLPEINAKIVDFRFQDYSPNYRFDLIKKQLSISVTESLYNSVSQGAFIKKDTASDFLIVNNRKYRIINDKGYNWLPD